MCPMLDQVAIRNGMPGSVSGVTGGLVHTLVQEVTTPAIIREWGARGRWGRRPPTGHSLLDDNRQLKPNSLKSELLVF